MWLTTCILGIPHFRNQNRRQDHKSKVRFHSAGVWFKLMLYFLSQHWPQMAICVFLTYIECEDGTEVFQMCAFGDFWNSFIYPTSAINRHSSCLVAKRQLTARMRLKMCSVFSCFLHINFIKHDWPHFLIFQLIVHKSSRGIFDTLIGNNKAYNRNNI